jgi:hypothetical protein
MSLPPSEIPSGAMRFNSDSQKLEYYDGAQWLQVSTFSPNLNGGARGLFMGGNNSPTLHNSIDYITIATTGNAIDFGDITQIRRRAAGFSDRTRGICAGGATPTAVNTIDYVTISSTGNAADFGDLIGTGSCDNTGMSNSTRGICKNGYTSPGATGTFNYVTIQSTGNAVNFGNLIANGDAPGNVCNSTRGILGGSYQPANDNTITFITISTLGNAADFGDLTVGRFSIAGASSSTRGIFAGGYVRSPGTPTGTRNIIDYITIATLGNAIDFGDLTRVISTSSGVSNCIRGVFGGGYAPSNSNVLDYIQFSSIGNAIDFGDMVVPGGRGSSCSNAHGGL